MRAPQRSRQTGTWRRETRSPSLTLSFPSMPFSRRVSKKLVQRVRALRAYGLQRSRLVLDVLCQSALVSPTHTRKLKLFADRWSAYWNASEYDQITTLIRMLGLAKKKLLGSTNNALRAALCCRLALGFSRAQNSHRLRDALVQDNMALALYIPQSRAFVMATYAAEPILAAAASSIMDDHGREKIINELIDLTSLSMIDRGPKGELMSKVTCILAFDSCSNSVDNSSQLRIFKPVTLSDFLCALTKQHNHLTRIWFDKAYGPSQHLLDEYRDYTCVLGQWIAASEIPNAPERDSAAEDTSIISLLKLAILAQCGIQCDPDDSLVDLWIPFASGSKLLAFAIQVKTNNERKGPLSPASFQSLRENGIPVIYLVHDVSDHQSGDPLEFRTEEFNRPTTRNDPVSNWAPLYHFVLSGLPTSGVEQWSMLLHAQCNPYADAGAMRQEHLLQSLPELTANPQVLRSLLGGDVMQVPAA